MKDGPIILLRLTRDVLLRAGRTMVMPKASPWLPRVARGAVRTKH